MKLFKFFLIVIFLFCFTNVNSSETKRELKNKISKNTRCLVCQGQSVYDSQSDFAVSVKLTIEQKLDEGLSEDEIYEFLKDLYGQWIVYDPEFNKNTFILWILPMLLLVRQWLGWTYVHKRLLSERVEYEESGWYDGQVWEKPLSWRERDLLLAQHEVRPILGRLGRAMATTTGLILGGASLCQAL